MTRLLLAPALGALIGAGAAAQDGATIAGRVVIKTSNAGVAGLEVLLRPGLQRVTTDSAGYFTFSRVTPAQVTVLVRRLGFRPESASFAVRASDRLELLIELEQAPQQLDTVNVAGREDVLVRGKLSGFYERKRFGIGRFVEATDLEGLGHRQMADLLSSRLPGIRQVRLSGSSAVAIATARRGGRTPCFAEVYLDGIIAYAGGVGMTPFDVNSLDPAHVAAIEFYHGPAQIPAQFNKTGSACGVLLIWTK